MDAETNFADALLCLRPLGWPKKEPKPESRIELGVCKVSAPLRPVRGREFQLLTEAHRARNKGRNRTAIRLYKRILIENPQNLDVALRVAPMLAMAGEGFEAWQLYRRAALDYAREKQFAECLAVYREACRFVPYEFDAWRLCAELQLKMNRPEGAFETLVDGRMHFGGPSTRAQAISLLSRARTIEPWDDDLLLDLAGLYASNDQKDVALELLGTLACRVTGPALRHVRWLQWRITYSIKDFWLWIRALVRPGSAGPVSTVLDPIDFEEPERPRLREVNSK